jgi:hypothetical protein
LIVKHKKKQNKKFVNKSRDVVNFTGGEFHPWWALKLPKYLIAKCNYLSKKEFNILLQVWYVAPSLFGNFYIRNMSIIADHY